MAEIFQRDISDMVDLDDGYRQHETVWAPCERCSGRVVGTNQEHPFGPVVRCEDCGRKTIVVDAL